MPYYRIPVFNLPVNIWRGVFVGSPTFPTAPPDVTCLANLSPGRLVSNEEDGFGDFTRFLRVPACTDIRGAAAQLFAGYSGDMVECPAWSGRFYIVTDVEDQGLGFANEHRCAFIVIWNDGYIGPAFWPCGHGIPFPPRPPAGPPAILMETSGYVLMETGSHILME